MVPPMRAVGDGDRAGRLRRQSMITRRTAAPVAGDRETADG
jgi:hypothetical protein